MVKDELNAFKFCDWIVVIVIDNKQLFDGDVLFNPFIFDITRIGENEMDRNFVLYRLEFGVHQIYIWYQMFIR